MKNVDRLDPPGQQERMYASTKEKNITFKNAHSQSA